MRPPRRGLEAVVRAVRVERLDGPTAVTVSDVPEPTAGPDQVLVDVEAAGVAFPDVLLTRGLYQYRPDLPFTLGAEIAGVVRRAPEGGAVRPGDRVAAFPMFGGFAEAVAVDPSLVLPMPEGMAFDVAAALPMNYLTAHFALVRRAALQPGQTVLVHGAAGGLGTATLQVARALGARTIAVVSSPEKATVATDAGADRAVAADGFRDAVADLTGGRGVDVVVDPVGGDRFTDSLRCLATEGRLLVLGFTAGEIPTVKVNRLLLANTSVMGVGWGAFWMARPGFLQEQWSDVVDWWRQGLVDPPIGARLPLSGAAEALAVVEDRGALGKLVLTTHSA